MTLSAKPRVTHRNYHNISLNEWQKHFRYLYGSKNLAIQLEREDICNHIIDTVSHLSENLRLDEYGLAMIDISRMLAWVFALLGPNEKLKNTFWSLEDIIWNKYPYVCPYCTSDLLRTNGNEDLSEEEFHERLESAKKQLVCKCPTIRKELEGLEEKIKSQFIRKEVIEYYKGVNEHKKPKTLDGWLKMFDDIYGNVNHNMPISQIAFHLHEEVGEVQRVIMKYDASRNLFEGKRVSHGRVTEQINVELRNEISDVFSWTSALINHFISMSQNFNKFREYYNLDGEPLTLSLASALFEEYGTGCPRCKQERCHIDCRPKMCSYELHEENHVSCSYEWNQSRSQYCKYGLTERQKTYCEH